MSSPDHDPTESIRRKMVAEINEHPKMKEELQRMHGKVWSTQEMVAEFEVESFLAPFVCVVRKKDRVKGTLLFQHHPRFYYDFKPSPLTAKDPREQRIFYALHCTFWTDDFSKLHKLGDGIPCCPICKSVGFESTVKEWNDGITHYVRKMNDEKYPELLTWMKEKCLKNIDVAREQFEKEKQ